MQRTRVLLTALAALSPAACAVDLTCDEPQAYQAAREGVRVTVPDDLDELQASRETPIPKASPRDPRPEGAPCLDLPPTLSAAPDGDEPE